jgi:hypothetical protein
MGLVRAIGLTVAAVVKGARAMDVDCRTGGKRCPAGIARRGCVVAALGHLSDGTNRAVSNKRSFRFYRFVPRRRS